MSPLSVAAEWRRNMERPLLMSRRERTRLGVMNNVKAGTLSLVAAATVLDLSYRQAKRVWQRYRQQGDSGLVHRSRGRAGTDARAWPCARRSWRATGSVIRILGQLWPRSTWA